MAEIQIFGKVKYIGNDVKVSESFTKRELVVTTDEQYPQHILINFVQDRCDLIDKLTVNQKVTVSVNIRGREWTNTQGEVKYFNDIQGWKVSKHTDAQDSTHAAPQAPTAVSATQAAANLEEEEDDLPF